ncbi:MAG: energy-coupling factor transporter ATPase [Clostridiales bacterium]|jgi:energy-coupling factor transport system ATP-binding protein|nr:energy-coupling factor transporter ATPase [Clostridiales bacterium]
MSIEIENLSHTYGKGSTFEKKALDHVSLTIKKGEFVGLIGHTGSGKSTLIQHLNVLLRPETGSIIIDGEDIGADKGRLKAIRSKVGLVFQYPEHQLFEMTVFKDVAFGPANMGIGADETRRRVLDALEIVGIPPDLHEKSPFELSGGQKRRVAIAGVLAMRPEILVLDEPTAGLDPRGRDEILGRVKDMHEKLQLTVILVSHSMEDIARLVDRIVVINHGKIALQGAPAEIFAQIDALEAIGLASTQAAYVAKRLQDAGFALADGIYTPERAIKEILRLIC